MPLTGASCATANGRTMVVPRSCVTTSNHTLRSDTMGAIQGGSDQFSTEKIVGQKRMYGLFSSV